MKKTRKTKARKTLLSPEELAAQEERQRQFRVDTERERNEFAERYAATPFAQANPHTIPKFTPTRGDK